jgi:transcriptional regulator with XRE-family HTH domain
MYENRIYIPEPTPRTDRPMTKYIAPKGEGFGTRLAQLRKAAGYTQEQLATELGISRRRIAYYEAESDHPPVGFLGDLARVLNTTTDELLGHGAGKAKTRSVSLSPRLERRLKQIERLSAKPKQQLLSIIDSFIAAEEHRTQGANRSQGSRS